MADPKLANLGKSGLLSLAKYCIVFDPMPQDRIGLAKPELIDGVKLASCLCVKLHGKAK